MSKARVLVEIDVTKKLPDKIWIGELKSGAFQQVIIENMPLYCEKCKVFGHEGVKCAERLMGEAAMAGGEMDGIVADPGTVLVLESPLCNPLVQDGGDFVPSYGQVPAPFPVAPACSPDPVSGVNLSDIGNTNESTDLVVGGERVVNILLQPLSESDSVDDNEMTVDNVKDISDNQKLKMVIDSTDGVANKEATGGASELHLGGEDLGGKKVLFSNALNFNYSSPTNNKVMTRARGKLGGGEGGNEGAEGEEKHLNKKGRGKQNKGSIALVTEALINPINLNV